MEAGLRLLVIYERLGLKNDDGSILHRKAFGLSGTKEKVTYRGWGRYLFKW